MQCFERRESENIKERRKIYAARDFSDNYDHALFKYQIKFVKFLIISLKRLLLIKSEMSVLRPNEISFSSSDL
jgi:hypothetical protein